MEDTVGCSLKTEGERDFMAVVTGLSDVLSRTPVLEKALFRAMMMRKLLPKEFSEGEEVTSPDLEKILKNNNENA